MPRLLIVALAVLTVTTTSFAQGIIAPTAGPINSSMAGASVAAPVDFGGSYWNPAIISGLPRNEFLLGSQLLIPSFHMTSSLPAGAIEGVFPPTNRYGVARSDSGVASNLSPRAFPSASATIPRPLSESACSGWWVEASIMPAATRPRS
jgi:long-chain fatty acid transport protein